MERVALDVADKDRFLLQEGDLLFARRSLTAEGAGKCCILISVPEETTWESSIIRARLATEIVEPGFYYYFFSSDIGRRSIETIVEQVAAAGIRSSDLAKLMVPVPSLAKQRGIVSMLRALDDKIAVNDRIVRASRKLMMLKYSHAISSGVHSVVIGEIASLFDGPHATPKKTDSGPWFLSISSLNGGRLELGESAHLSDNDFEQWTRRVTPKAGDVLFSYETRLGEAALMPAGIRACLGRRMALLRPHGVGSVTLLQAFLSPSFQESIRQYSVHGATVDRIPLSEFPSWNISLPAKDPCQLETVLGHLNEIAESRENENGVLAKLRDALLPKLMSGEIRVRDAEKVVEDVT